MGGNDEAGDARLWEKSLQGDGAAFGLLFDRHRDRVFRHAYRLAGKQQDAEDVMSTAFLELCVAGGRCGSSKDQFSRAAGDYDEPCPE